MIDRCNVVQVVLLRNKTVMFADDWLLVQGGLVGIGGITPVELVGV